MTPETFYRRALLVPVVLPLLAAVMLGTLLAAGASHRREFIPVLDATGYLALAGAWGALPYVVFLLVVAFWVRPRTERHFRRLSWIGPGAIALTFGAVVAVIELLRGGSPRNAAMQLGFWGGNALVVGYLYSLLVNGAFVLGRRLGWVSGTPPRE